jgi:hypothetical protein
MAKRKQINLTVDDAELKNILEYCRVHGLSTQGMLKAGVNRLIMEDVLERNADLRTLQAWREMRDGLAKPIDDLLDMIDEDEKIGNEMLATKHGQSAVNCK